MATCTLTLYKLSRLKNSKNYVIDEIETYLSSLSSITITDFQYQRFEINTSIKVNMSQDLQTKSTSVNKYDYLKMTTKVNNVDVVYYYFIIGYAQVSQNTIQLQLRMDTLNTFRFSNVASNDSYTLSSKTIVNREHKDRLQKLSTKLIYVPLDTETAFALQEIENWFAYQNSSDQSVYLTFNTDGVKTFMNNHSLINLAIDCLTQNGAYVQYNDNQYNNVSKITFDTQHNEASVYDTNNQIVLDINITSLVENFFVVIPPSGNVTQNFSTYSGDWFEFMNRAYYHYASVQEVADKCKRIINPYQEGISTILFKKREQTLYDDDQNNQWYVVFASTNAVQSTSVDYAEKLVNPVQVRFYSDNGYTISTSSSHEVVLLPTSNLIPKWKYDAELIKFVPTGQPNVGTQYIKVGGVTYDFHDYVFLSIKRTNNTDFLFSWVHLIKRSDSSDVYIYNVDSVTFYGIDTLRVEGENYLVNRTTIYIGSGGGSYTGSCSKWEDLDLTDSRFIKAFAFPYCPCDFMVGKSSFTSLPSQFAFNLDNFIQLNNAQKYEFKYQKRFNISSPLAQINMSSTGIGYQKSRDILYESKLYHSDYYQPKFVYDSFSFTFNLEYLDVDSLNEAFPQLDSYFYVTYIVSRNIQSKFAFIFDEYVTDKSTQDYENVLTIERNNEKALYNNAYINYIRSGGYSYDTKKASSQNAVNGITTALSIVGAVASFVSTPHTGGMGAVAGISLTTSALAGITRSVYTAQEQDKAIAQKMNQAVMQGTSVQGSEDIDILTAISGNKAKLVYYELSDIMKQAMWDLFHQCGYATKEEKIPDVTTRLYFNFVQADIVFANYNFDEDIADDIKSKWSEGITFFHKVNGEYDIEQQYENFEVSLL